jgi:hypothetical protein
VTNLFGRPTFVRPTNVDGALQIFTPHWLLGVFPGRLGRRRRALRQINGYGVGGGAVADLSGAELLSRAQPIDFEELEATGTSRSPSHRSSFVVSAIQGSWDSCLGRHQSHRSRKLPTQFTPSVWLSPYARYPWRTTASLRHCGRSPPLAPLRRPWRTVRPAFSELPDIPGSNASRRYW